MKRILIVLMVLVQTAGCNPIMEMPDVVECETDVNITCEGNGTPDSYSWYFNGSDIASKAGVLKRYRSKYSTEVNGTTLFLTLHKTDAVKDAGTYACEYAYNGTISKYLKTECKAAEIVFKIQSNKTMVIDADRLYPNEAKFKTSIWTETDGHNIVQGSVRCHNSDTYDGYFRCNWQSTTAIPDGDYFYSVIVTSITDSMPFNGSFLIASPRAPVFINTIVVNGIGEVIRGNEGDDLTVKCVSRGGYPRPNVVLYVNDSSLSDNVTSTLNTTYTVTTEHTFKSIPRSYNGAFLHCRSSYNGSENIQSTTVQLNLYFGSNKATISGNKTIVVDGKNKLQLSCESRTSNPPSTITWKFNKTIIHDYQNSTTSVGKFSGLKTSQILTITPTRHNDGETITCEAQNIRMTEPVSTSVKLNLTYNPIAKISGQLKRNIREGDKLVLKCLAKGKPKPTFTWFHNSSQRGQEADLVIESVSRRDYGNYTCRASNGILPNSKATVALYIQFGSRYTTISGNKIIEADGKHELQLSCESNTSVPASTIAWKFNKTIMHEKCKSETIEGRYGGIKTRQKLTINPTRHNDGETITCEAQNNLMAEPVSNSVTLNLTYNPIAKISGQLKRNIREGDKLVLKCLAKGKPKPTFTWFHNSSQRGQEADLVIESVSRRDYGNYTCRASNGILPNSKATVALYIQFGSRYTTISGNKIIEADGKHELQLSCESNTSVPASTIAWKFNKTIMHEKCKSETIEGRYGGIKTRQKLTINPTRHNDGETITCEAQNNLMAEPVSNSVTLNLTYNPIAKISGQLKRNIREGDKLVLKCLAKGKPKPTFTWFHNSSQRGQEADLVIESVSRRDYGNYTCRASNGILPNSKATVALYIQFGSRYTTISGNKIIEADGKHELQLSCESNTSVPASTIAWKFNKTIMHEKCKSETIEGRYGGIKTRQKLTINPTRHNDGETITCEAQNNLMAEPVSNSVTLNLTYNPIAKISGQLKRNIREGDKLVLKCLAKGKPKPTFTWFHNSSQRGQEADLVIERVSRRDYGNYTCRASNGILPNSKATVALYIQFGSRYTTISGNKIIEADGKHELQLSCESNTSVPASTIAWKFNKTIMHEKCKSETIEGRYGGIKTRQKLTINPTRHNDGETITCEAQNNLMAEPVSNSVTLNLTYNPIAKISGQLKRNIREGDKLVLKCLAKGKPKPTFTWFHNSSQRGQEADLVIESVSRRDYGNYTCRASNGILPNSKATVALYIQFGSKKVTINGNKKMNVDSTNELQLYCVSRTSNPASTITWIFNQTINHRYQNSTTSAGKFGGEKTRQILTITPTRHNDGETITCEAINYLMAEPVSDSIKLNLTFPPDLHMRTKNVTVNDKEAVIHCDAHGVPNEYIFSNWKQVWPGTNALLRVIENKRDTLTLTNLTYEYSGLYICGASNGIMKFGTNLEFMEESIYLHVKSFPIITKHADWKASSMLNAYASFEFEFFSNAGQNRIECFKNISGDDVIECSMENSTTLTTLPIFDTQVETDGFNVLIKIHTRHEDAFGVYTIKVTNEIGESTFSLHVDPSGPPCVPYNVSVDEITETSATLSWIRCFHGGFDQTFVIQLSKDCVLWNNKTFIEGGQSMNMTPITNYLHSLESTSTYSIRLFAYNHIGRSNYSEGIIFTTKSVAVTTLQLAWIGGAGGGGFGLIVIIIVASVLVMKHRRNKDHNENIGANDGDDVGSEDEDDLDGLQENPMYISADLIANPTASGAECVYAMSQKAKKPIITTKGKVKVEQYTSDVYATVNKVHKKVSANKNAQKNENLYENYELKQSSKGAPKKIEQPVVLKRNINKDGLQYVEAAFKNTPSGDSRLVIHGLEDRTPYAQIDFTKKADPLPDSEEEDEDEGKK